jgi:hypothetical protein
VKIEFPTIKILKPMYHLNMAKENKVQRKSLALLEALEDVAVRHGHNIDWTPALYLAEVAADESRPDSLRIEAAKAASPYFTPRLQQIDMKSLSILANLETTDAETKALAKQKLYQLLASAKSSVLEGTAIEVLPGPQPESQPIWNGNSREGVQARKRGDKTVNSEPEGWLDL